MPSDASVAGAQPAASRARGAAGRLHQAARGGRRRGPGAAGERQRETAAGSEDRRQRTAATRPRVMLRSQGFQGFQGRWGVRAHISLRLAGEAGGRVRPLTHHPENPGNPEVSGKKCQNGTKTLASPFASMTRAPGNPPISAISAPTLDHLSPGPVEGVCVEHHFRDRARVPFALNAISRPALGFRARWTRLPGPGSGSVRVERELQLGNRVQRHTGG